MLTAITQAIKAEFRYEGRQAEGTNDPLVTLATKTGACRDYTLFMMEAVRSLGLAARFVSGYLYDERLVSSGAPVIGGGATHAWVEVYLPGAGWVEFDPHQRLGGRTQPDPRQRRPHAATGGPDRRQLPRAAGVVRQHEGKRRGRRRPLNLSGEATYRFSSAKRPLTPALSRRRREREL